MFKKLQIESEEPLKKLLKQSESVLLKSIQLVHYPSALKQAISSSEWRNNYHKIDSLNQPLLDSVSGKAGVYSLFTQNIKKQWDVLYIGQTQSKTARQRIRSHIVWRNKQTRSGKFTGSQFDEVQGIIMAGEELGFSFVEIYPAPIRHYIEENLIKKLNPPWNKHKRAKHKV